MNYKKILLLLCIIVLIISQAEAAKKKKSRSKSSNKRPSNVSPELFCNACQAMVRETLKKIKDSRKEYDIHDALSNICSDRNYNIYEFPPPEMRKGCEAFMGPYEELVENSLMKRANNDDIENEICIQKTKVCKGVDPLNRQKTPQTINVNGKDVPIGDDGSVKMNDDL